MENDIQKHENSYKKIYEILTEQTQMKDKKCLLDIADAARALSSYFDKNNKFMTDKLYKYR